MIAWSEKHGEMSDSAVARMQKSDVGVVGDSG